MPTKKVVYGSYTSLDKCLKVKVNQMFGCQTNVYVTTFMNH